MERVLITGATGLIGSHIAEYFADKGLRPVCMVRQGSKIDFLKTINVEIVTGDISDIRSLEKVLGTGFDFVIHTAAKVGDWGRYEDFYNTNVEGTLNVLRTAKLYKIDNIIITGSISCYGEEPNQKVKDETHPYNSHYNYFLDSIFPSGMNYYRDTKAEAGIRAIEYAKENKLNLTILHPAWVFGEREFHSGFYDFLSTIKSGITLVPGSAKNKFHTIYARDLSAIYYLAYKKRLSVINEFLAVSPVAENQYKLFNMFCEKAGYKLPRRISKSVIYFPAFFTELFYTIFRIKSVPLISRARVNIFYDNIEYSSAKLISELGFSSRYSLEESVENTVRWYKENHYL